MRSASPSPGRPYPTGAVTLLFTDIEGSTQRWETGPDAMAEALRRHDTVLRASIASHGGYVFRTVGDAFCAAFASASDAVLAALTAQRALAAEDWSAVGGLMVRIALHSGTTDECDGDYFGPVVNRVARLLSVVHGGQVVLSATTAEFLRGALPVQTTLRDLGEHHLKDLTEPERVWQVVAPGLIERFPALVSRGARPNNLPQQLAPLAGRDDVIAEVEGRLGAFALVSLIATGDTGKTRIALQAGANQLDRTADGVWYLDLGSLASPDLTVAAVASTLGLREQPGRAVLDTLGHYLKHKHLLLVLDNCEDAIDEVARIVAAILRECPGVRVLATSREPLRVAGEHVYRLSAPVAHQDETAALIDRSDALLSDQDRALFCKLSIFTGGFTLEGATAVCCDDTIDEFAVLDALSALIDKSLAQADTGQLSRYRLLPGARRYAHRRLVESTEYERVKRAHAAFLARAEQRQETEGT